MDIWLLMQQFPSSNCISMPPDGTGTQSLPRGINPCLLFSENIALPGSRVPGITHSKLEESREAQLLQFPDPRAFLPSTDVYRKDNKSDPQLLGIKDSPFAISDSPHRGFLIFDRSGNQTRLLNNPLHSSVFPCRAVKALDCGLDLHKKKEVKTDVFAPRNAVLHEEIDGEDASEMHEDTEEINALLYSDDEEDYSDSDDEVRSTDHSPFPNEETCHSEPDQFFEEIIEEVASSDRPSKRTKLLDGGYKTSCLSKTKKSENMEDPCMCTDFTGLSHISDHTQKRELGLNFRNKQATKDKLRDTLRTLAKIIPGAKGKDSLFLLDEAIEYLKVLKQKAHEGNYF